MSLNWKEIDLVLQELNLAGMQIQKVFQSNYDTLALQLYGRLNSTFNTAINATFMEKTSGENKADNELPRAHLILICLSPLSCRMHETFRAVPKSEKPLRFAEFLKSRLVGGRIEEAVQLGEDRIVRLKVKRGEERFLVYIRLWSNAANVIVTDINGTVLDAMKRLPKKGETSGGVYRPEAQDERKSLTQRYGEHSGNEKNYEVRELPGEGSFNSRLDAWYAEHSGKQSLDYLREEVSRVISKNRARLNAALERLKEKEADYARGDRFKEYGDLILSNTAALSASNAKSNTDAVPAWLDTESYSGEPIRIQLDPRKTPADNAAYYYDKYRKAKNGLGSVQDEIAQGEKELQRLLEMEKQFLQETNPLKLETLLKKIRRGLLVQKKAAEKKRPGLSFYAGDWLILVGRDATENDELLRRHVKGNDLWLHVRDWAGGYVFIKNRPNKTVPLEILLDAGNLALFYSKGRNNKRGDLYYTQVKYLRRAKNGPKGLVIPTQEKNLHIVLDEERLKRMKNEQ